MKKVLLITGGSSGIGRAAADLFAKEGYIVYELSRHGEDRQGVSHIDCDVTNAENCKHAVAKVIEKEKHIDLLISNAGMGISGPIEFSTSEEMHRQMEVNFFGSVNIAQAVLPYMREQAKTPGAHKPTIIFTSSVAAIFSIPFQAFYSASKFAINALAMALRNEVRPFGINVACLLPGDVKTGFTDARVKSVAGADVYTRLDKAVTSMEHDEINGIAPERMAKKLYKIAQKSSPSAFYTVGLQYHFFMFLNKIIPASLAYRIVGMMY